MGVERKGGSLIWKGGTLKVTDPPLPTTFLGRIENNNLIFIKKPCHQFQRTLK